MYLLGDDAHLPCGRIGLVDGSSVFVSSLSEIGISYEWLTWMCHCVQRLVKDGDDPLLCYELSGGYQWEISVLLLLLYYGQHYMQ